MNAPAPTGRFARWRPVLTALVLVAAFAYLAVAVKRQWQELTQHEWSIRWGLCALSFALTGGWFGGRGLLWQTTLKCFGCALGYREAFRMWALSELGRYLPGNVWYVLGRGCLAAEKGIAASVAFACMALELLVVLLGAVLVFCLGTGTQTGIGPLLRLAGPVATVVAVVLVHPRALGALFRLARRQPPPQFPALPQLLGLLLLGVALWLVTGLAFAIFVSSLVPLPLSHWRAAGSAYAAAWTIGLLAVLAPGGLGVRESALHLLLSPLLPPDAALVIALASRVWITVAEGVSALLALWVGRLGAGRPHRGRRIARCSGD